MISRVVSMVRWSAAMFMGMIVDDVPSSRSSDRMIRPGWALGEVGLLPNKRVGVKGFVRLMFLFLRLLMNDVHEYAPPIE